MSLQATQIREDFILFGKSIALGLAGLLGYIVLTGYLLAPSIRAFSQTQGYPIATTAVTLILTFIVLYRTVAEKWKFGYLQLISFGFLGFNFFQIFDWSTALDNTPFQRPLGFPLLYIADLFIPLQMLFLYLHFASLYREDHHPLVLILLAVLVMPYFPLTVLAILGNSNALQLLRDLLPFMAVAAMWITAYAIKIVFDLFTLSKHRRMKVNALTSMIGLLYMAFAFVSQVLSSDSIDFSLFHAEIFQLLLLSVGIVLVLFPYVTGPDFIHVTCSHVYEMIMYDSGGDVIWSYDFDAASVLDLDLSAAKIQIIDTVTTLLREMSGFVGQVRRMEFSRSNTLLIASNDVTSLLLMVHRLSKQQLHTTAQFYKRLLELGESPSPEELNGLLKVYFPQYFSATLGSS